MQSENKHFPKEELEEIDAADDLHISPFRANGKTYGTPTWIWSVVVNGDLYVRAYNGVNSRWYQSALKQNSGRINAAGKIIDVAFEPVAGAINSAIDEAYKKKYNGSPYLFPMINETAKAATIKIIPLTEKLVLDEQFN